MLTFSAKIAVLVALNVSGSSSNLQTQINSKVDSSTLSSTLTNYLGFDLPRTTATVKSISMSDWNLLKFEDGPVPLFIIDRVNSWGYTTNTVITSNFGSLRNIYCAVNMYLRSESRLYLDDLESQYLTTDQLLNVSGSTSNLQTQINSKVDINDFNATNTTNLNLINTKAGVFTPLPPLHFSLNIEGEAPIMNLVMAEDEITTLSNFFNKDEIITKINILKSYLSSKVSGTTLHAILDDYDTATTSDSKIATVTNILAQNITTQNISCVTNLYFDNATTIHCNYSRTVHISPYELG